VFGLLLLCLGLADLDGCASLELNGKANNGKTPQQAQLNQQAAAQHQKETATKIFG